MSDIVTRDKLRDLLVEFEQNSSNTDTQCSQFHKEIMAHDAALRARVEELERERGECVRDMSGWMDNGQTLSLAICAMRLNASTLKQQVADLTARLAAAQPITAQEARKGEPGATWYEEQPPS